MREHRFPNHGKNCCDYRLFHGKKIHSVAFTDNTEDNGTVDFYVYLAPDAEKEAYIGTCFKCKNPATERTVLIADGYLTSFLYRRKPYFISDLMCRQHCPFSFRDEDEALQFIKDTLGVSDANI